MALAFKRSNLFSSALVSLVRASLLQELMKNRTSESRFNFVGLGNMSLSSLVRLGDRTGLRRDGNLEFCVHLRDMKNSSYQHCRTWNLNRPSVACSTPRLHFCPRTYCKTRGTPTACPLGVNLAAQTRGCRRAFDVRLASYAECLLRSHGTAPTEIAGRGISKPDSSMKRPRLPSSCMKQISSTAWLSCKKLSFASRVGTCERQVPRPSHLHVLRISPRPPHDAITLLRRPR